MAKTVDWEGRIGRRLRLRDLHIFFAVVESGSMAKAGTLLRVTQPAVSKAIGDLEAAIGVRLLDRSPRLSLIHIFARRKGSVDRAHAVPR